MLCRSLRHSFGTRRAVAQRPADTGDTTTLYSAAERVTRYGILWNLLLTLFKGSAAIVSGSKALFADAMESASDIAVSIGVLFSLHVAKQPMDQDHPYGHGKVESVVAQVIGITLIVAATGILYYAILNILDPPKRPPAQIALWAALITIVVKELLYRYTIKTGRQLKSPAVTANAWGHRSDAYSSIVTVMGIGGALLGFPILDPVAAGVVSLFIYRMGVSVLRQSTYELMDGRADQDILERVVQVAEQVEGVEHAHEIKGRRYGQTVLLDLTLEMDPKMSLKHSHKVAHAVKDTVLERVPEIANVMIHINPHVHPHTHSHEV